MINVNIDVMLGKRKMSSGELAQRIGITQANLSILKTGKAKAIRFETLDSICRALECQPGDVLEFKDEGTADEGLENFIKAIENSTGIPEKPENKDLPPAERFFQAIATTVEAQEEGEA